MADRYVTFSEDSPEMGELKSWWISLENNRGDRAKLRRCHTLIEVAFLPVFHRLRLEVEKHGRIDYDSLALVAALVARVKNSSDALSIAEQMATGKQDGSARVSGLRFRRLLKVKDNEHLYAAIARVIALLGGTANVQSLAEGVYQWNDITRKRWAFDYYAKAPTEK
jgi:CRISPR system Cascade subunit CasB